ncbi:MAG: ACP S-malonyltransferase [Fimbriimonadaceae bacterium]|nr:ACP S-malonyltransferase [Fimbriimonadaceae bacterium]
MIAVVFPGQGSQTPGMGQGYDSAAVREIFDRISGAVGRDVAELCSESDSETLKQTQNAQIALYAAGLAGWAALSERAGAGRFAAFAGHSVGEYAALAAAGVVSVEAGAGLVKERGRIMAESGLKRPGTMAAVLGLDRPRIEELIESAGIAGIVVVANDNCPGQVVISGDLDAVQAASAHLADHGARRVLPLNVSGAFHSPLMEESSREMAGFLAETSFQPGLPVYSNVLAAPGEAWAELLQRQLREPVRWTETVRRLAADGVTDVVECGVGEVLSGLIRRTEPEIRTHRVVDQATLEETLSALESKS